MRKRWQGRASRCGRPPRGAERGPPAVTAPAPRPCHPERSWCNQRSRGFLTRRPGAVRVSSTPFVPYIAPKCTSRSARSTRRDIGSAVSCGHDGRKWPSKWSRWQDLAMNGEWPQPNPATVTVFIAISCHRDHTFTAKTRSQKPAAEHAAARTPPHGSHGHRQSIGLPARHRRWRSKRIHLACKSHIFVYVLFARARFLMHCTRFVVSCRQDLAGSTPACSARPPLEGR